MDLYLQNFTLGLKAKNLLEIIQENFALTLSGARLINMEKDCKICKYFWNMLIAVDQLVNTALGGDPDETISSRAGKRQHEATWARWLCWFLGKIDNNHCNESIEEDEGKDESL